MRSTNSPRRMGEILEHLFRHWETQGQSSQSEGEHGLSGPRAFTIALSREAGTNGTAVAHDIGQRLGWQVYDYELLERIAQEMGLRTKLLESVDERRQNWLLEAFETLSSVPMNSDAAVFVSESAYVHNLIKTVLALGVHGQCVIVGRGAPFILPPATTLRVRLVAPVMDRILTVMSRSPDLSERQAAHEVRDTDRERNDFIRDHFMKDPEDVHNFDLVINVSRLNVADCADLIIDALHGLEPPATHEQTPALASIAND
jgi:cytidylate kinase